jgi:phosphoesterase RecJ-like protein
VTVASPDPGPRAYDFLPGVETIVPWQDVAPGEHDLVALYDCADERRAGAPLPLGRYAPRVLQVDHHATNSRFGDVKFVDPLAAASAELAHRTLELLGVTVDRDLALLLYVGLETDTGGFRYSSTTPASLRLAARLLDAGIDPGEVSELVYERQAVGGLRLLGLALDSLRLRPDLSLAYFVLGDEEFRTAGATAQDAETIGIVDYARRLEGFEVAALLRSDGPGEIKLSLRSKGGVDVARLAARIGGGGHERAAGATIHGDLAQAEEVLLQLLAQP